MRNFKNIKGRHSDLNRKFYFSTREEPNHHARRWVKRHLEKDCRKDAKAEIREHLEDDTMEVILDEVDFQNQGEWEYVEFEDFDRGEEFDRFEADAYSHFQDRLKAKAEEKFFYEDDYYHPQDFAM